MLMRGSALLKRSAEGAFIVIYVHKASDYISFCIVLT